MAVEEVVEAYWQLKGYWTKLRYPLNTGKNNYWTDIDVVAYHPKKKELIICESKVKGKNHTVRPYTFEIENHLNIIEFDKRGNGEKKKSDYLLFIQKMNNEFLHQVLEKLNIPEEGTKFVVHLVSNYWIEEDIKEEVKKYLMDEINKNVSSCLIDRIEIDTTFDILCKIMEYEEEKNQGKRYGNTIIDVTREINRYMHPQVEKMKMKEYGISKDETKSIEKRLNRYLDEKLKNALEYKRSPKVSSEHK